MCRDMGVFFFQAEDGIRYLVRSRGLGDVYKRQELGMGHSEPMAQVEADHFEYFYGKRA